MKWEGYTSRGEEKMRKLFGVKGLVYLLSILTFGLLLGANVKWHG